MDTETGLYYLMSRYYDPVTHRFVNSDGYFQSGGDILDTNMNAYCGNNPVNYVDPTGKCYIHTSWYVPTCHICTGIPITPEPKYESTSSVLISSIKNNNSKNGNWKPRIDKKKGWENRQPSGSRERNVGHPDGEEHSRVPKGNGIRRIEYDFYDKIAAVEGIVVSVIGIAYLVANDITGVGIADDVAIAPAAMVIWECAIILGG